jgi:putative FmdB family regulatory protein
MPIYEYHCKNCSANFELMRSVNKMTASTKCPSCGTRSQRRLTSFAFVRGAKADFEESSNAEPEDFGMEDDFDF